MRSKVGRMCELDKGILQIANVDWVVWGGIVMKLARQVWDMVRAEIARR
jgi:hypothetical protein